MKLFIPACGDRIILTAPWTFFLYLEYRNVNFAKAMKLVKDNFSRYSGYRRGGVLKKVECILPEGTILECDRVYVRSTNKSRLNSDDDYDSITWKVIQKNGKAKRHGRFWAKLAQCNEIEFRLEHDSLYRDRVKLPRQVMES